MSTLREQTQLLDQLQAEINRVLEQTGRLFAAANSGSKSAPAAHAARLKKEVPGSISRFHEALDQLEDELQLARMVLRRDLAVNQEKSGKSISNAVTSSTTTGRSTPITKGDLDPRPDRAAPAQAPVSGEVAVQKPSVDDPAPTKPVEQRSNVTDQKVNESAIATENGPQPAAASKIELEPTTGDRRASESALPADTQPPPLDIQPPTMNHPDDDDDPPNSGTFSNNADLDSLFGGPTSASGGNGPGEAPQTAPDFNLDSHDPSSNGDFDFDAFSTGLDTNGAADNDNISALLPGLQDYANTQPMGSADAGGEPDFNALFGTDASLEGGDSQNGGGGSGDQQGAGEEQRDTTFDDLMDFGDFNAGDYTTEGGGGGGAGTSGQDFDDFTFE